MPAWDPARDREGIEQAVLDLLEEGFALSRAQKSIDLVDDETAERMVGAPPRKLSPGYYKLGEFLLWLFDLVEMKLIDPSRITATELEGLKAMRAAKREFETRHPACGACGARQDSKFAQACHDCGVEFGRKK